MRAGGTGEAPGRELAAAARASEACDGRSAHAGDAPGRPAGVACPPERRRCTPPATRAGPNRRTGRGHIQDQQASLGACGGRGACVTPQSCRAPRDTVSGLGPHQRRPGAPAGRGVASHHGILCLDARPEYRRHGLAGLRQPLEDGITSIQPPARPRPRCARCPGWASGMRVDRDRLASTLISGGRRSK